MINWKQAQPAPLALWRLVHANFPETRNLGIFNDRNVAGTNIKSAHAEGRALDIGLKVSKPSQKRLGDGLFQALFETGTHMGLDHVIWNHRIWSREKGGPRAYHGVNPHTDHIHVA